MWSIHSQILIWSSFQNDKLTVYEALHCRYQPLGQDFYSWLYKTSYGSTETCNFLHGIILYLIIIHGSSLSRQDKLNPALWLAIRVGKTGSILSAQDYSLFLTRKWCSLYLVKMHLKNYSILTSWEQCSSNVTPVQKVEHECKLQQKSPSWYKDT